MVIFDIEPKKGWSIILLYKRMDGSFSPINW
jgi:hypothetical protein